MSLTYLDAKSLLAQYAGRGGRCSTADIDRFVKEVFEYLLYTGAYQDLRQFIFTAQNGSFTVPYEVESIQKVRIDNRSATSFDKWFEFRPSKFFDERECLPASDAIYEQANYYCTAYDVPTGGAQIASYGTCDEADDAHIIISGKDLTGREIFTTHKGEQISGEYISIKKGVRILTSVTFGQITSIKKSKTNGYVQLFWVRPILKQLGFLSDYSPLEELPTYRRYKLTNALNCASAKVSILARIRLKEAYADTDRIPFETLLTLRLAGQHVNSEYNNDTALAQAKDAAVNVMVEKESAHKRVQNGSPIEFFQGTSAGRIKNIVGSPIIVRWR